MKRTPDDPDVLYYFGHATALVSEQALNRLGRIKPDALAAYKASPETDEKGPAPDLESLRSTLAQHPDDPALLAQFARAAALASRRAFDQIVDSHAGSARAHQVAAEHPRPAPG